MALGWSKSRFSPIAIDFGADSLKLLQIIPGDPPQLVAAGAIEAPEATRTDAAARREFFVDSLRSLLKQQKFQGHRAICSIPAYHTLIQHVQVTKGEPADVAQQVDLQLRQRLNIDPSRMVVRHFQVGQIVRDGANKQEVICVAASRESVMRHIETAHRAKLDVVGMYCEPEAVLRSFAHLYRRQGDQLRTTCFIDMGAATTKVIIAHGSQMVFAKTIHAGGDQLTRQRATADGLSFAEARSARMQQIVTAAAAPAPDSPEGIALAAQLERRNGSPAPGLAILDAQVEAEARIAAAPAPTRGIPAKAEQEADVVDCLVDEMQMCMRYYLSVFPDRPVEKLVFLGGESHNVAMCQRIARTLRIGAQR